MPAPPFPTLETDRLRLREIVEADAPAIYSVHADPVVLRWMGSDPPPHVEATRQLIRTYAGWRELPSPATRWGIEKKGESQLIGSCGLYSWNRAWRKCNIGYELAAAEQGQGYMEETLRAVLGWGFKFMQLHRVEALIHPDNAPSIRLAVRLGFVEEGRMRELGRWAGRQHDMMMYALLAHELRP